MIPPLFHGNYRIYYNEDGTVSSIDKDEVVIAVYGSAGVLYPSYSEFSQSEDCDYLESQNLLAAIAVPEKSLTEKLEEADLGSLINNFLYSPEYAAIIDRFDALAIKRSQKMATVRIENMISALNQKANVETFERLKQSWNLIAQRLKESLGSSIKESEINALNAILETANFPARLTAPDGKMV